QADGEPGRLGRSGEAPDDTGHARPGQCGDREGAADAGDPRDRGDLHQLPHHLRARAPGRRRGRRGRHPRVDGDPRQPAAPHRGRGPKQREALWGTLLAAPATLHTLLWVGVPIVVAIALSFTSYDVITSARFTGLANYATILSDTLFWRSILHNVVLAAVGIP